MKRYTEAERKQFISQFQRSAMSTAAFCRARGISTVSLGLWRRRYGSTRRVADVAPAPAWVPVLLRPEPPAPPHFERPAGYALTAASGRLEVPLGFDAREVAALWRIMTASAAATGAEVAP